VDLFFLLLLLFLVSSTFLLHPGISVNLPFSKFTLGPQKNPVIVSITAGPYPLIYYRDQQISLEELAHQLEVDHVGDRSFIIQADRSTPQGSVIEVMNLCLEKGYSVVLATSPQEK
jgi:biopolymer transport protein ExbD